MRLAGYSVWVAVNCARKWTRASSLIIGRFAVHIVQKLKFARSIIKWSDHLELRALAGKICRITGSCTSRRMGDWRMRESMGLP
jgi:hypothetical protein